MVSIERPDWRQQEELDERMAFEAGLLRADPAYPKWLDQLEQEHTNDKRE